jgi:type I restriction enzyme R subunit
MITESKLEQLAIVWFQETGWSYIRGSDICPESPTPERNDYREVVLKNRLWDAIAKLNPQLPEIAVEEVVHSLANSSVPSLAKGNRELHELLINGVKVEYNTVSGRETVFAQVIDFQKPDNNDLLVVNQFTITGTKQSRRPDIVVFINGLPLAVVELKNPADETTDVWDAYSQFQTYKKEISDLLTFNVALVVSDGIMARVGSLTATQEWFMPWHVIKDENDRPYLEFELEKVVRGFFQPELFLDYIRHFVLFEEDGDKLIKKIAGYHQFHGVREAVRVTVIAANPEKPPERLGEERATYGREVVPLEFLQKNKVRILGIKPSTQTLAQ